MTTYIAIDIQDIDGNVLFICGEMKLAIEYIREMKLTQIDQDVVPVIDEEMNCTGENIIVITVEA